VSNISQREGHSPVSSILLRNQALLCCIALFVCTLISRPFIEIGINDDWSYIRSALLLAQTGHITFMGWSTPVLGWQLFLGALFIKLFGFSFIVVRSSVLLLSAVTVYLLHRVLVRCGVSEINATIGTLTFALSPLFLPLAFSFMTDIPGLFAIVLCFYLCLRALQASTDTSAFNWVIFAAVSNVVFGSVRQTSWLGVIVIVPSTLWLLRSRRIPWVKAGCLWFLSLLCILACVLWFVHQPFVQVERPVQNILNHKDWTTIFRTACFPVLNIALYLIPVTAALITPVWMKTRRARLAVFVVLAALAALVMSHYILYLRGNFWLRWLAPWGGNLVTNRGVIDYPEIGIRPVVLSIHVQIIITLVALVTASACVACIFGSSNSHEPESSTRYRIPANRELAILFAPFTIAYFALLMPRAAVGSFFERYVLPLLAVALVVVLRLYQQKVAHRLPVFSLVCTFIVAAYGVAATHDFYAMQRARLTAINELRAAGVARTAFFGGFAYDGWTQADSWGYVTSRNINLPPGTHLPPPQNASSKSCAAPYGYLDPGIDAGYALSLDPLTCQSPSGFASVPYRTWLSPYSGGIYIQAVTTAASGAPGTAR
jgi:hypothetical protein